MSARRHDTTQRGSYVAFSTSARDMRAPYGLGAGAGGSVIGPKVTAQRPARSCTISGRPPRPAVRANGYFRRTWSPVGSGGTQGPEPAMAATVATTPGLPARPPAAAPSATATGAAPAPPPRPESIPDSAAYELVPRASVGLGLLRKSQHLLADDVAL